MPKYNGFVLPAEPERDKTVYPFSIVQRIKYATGGFIAHYIYCTEAFYLDWTNKIVTYPDTATAFRCTYMSSDKEFAWSEPTTSANLNKNTDPNTVIWTNTDLYADNGMFFLGASLPTEVFKKWVGEKIYMKGFALGLAGAPAPFSPSPWINVGGYKTPAFPMFDRTLYTHFVVQRTEWNEEAGTYLYQIDAFQQPLSDPEYWGEDSATPDSFRWLNKNPGRLFSANWITLAESTKWSAKYIGPTRKNGTELLEEWEIDSGCLIFTSHDLYDPEGNLFMSAGEILPWKEAD